VNLVARFGTRFFLPRFRCRWLPLNYVTSGESYTLWIPPFQFGVAELFLGTNDYYIPLVCNHPALSRTPTEQKSRNYLSAFHLNYLHPDLTELRKTRSRII
jgi:hypothetical protein